MFSSMDYIQLVFANWHDTYYCSDLLQLNLEQYLWRNLHECGYKMVYFVKEKQGRLEISVYNEKNTKSYSEKKSLIKQKVFRQTEDVHLVEWVQEQLRENKCAFVWPLDIFCGLKKRGKAAEQLDSLRRQGKMLLVASPHAESSGKYLLEKDSVFDLLGISYITEARDESTGDYYRLLKSKGRERCVFLNGYTKERLTDLLKHVVFRYLERFTSEEDLRRMGEYLACYLNNRCMQWEESIFEKDFDLSEPMYSALYAQLCRESVWKRLTGKIGKPRDMQMTVSKYLKEIYGEGMIQFPEKREVWIFPKRDSLEWKCRNLVPMAENETDAEYLTLLNDLCRSLERYGNGAFHSKVYGSMESFLKKAEHISGGYPVDFGTHKRIVRVLQICSEQRYSSESEAVAKMLDWMNGYIAASEALFLSQMNYNSFLQNVKGQEMDEFHSSIRKTLFLKMQGDEHRIDSMDTGLHWLLCRLTGEAITEEQKKLADEAETAIKNAIEIMTVSGENKPSGEEPAEGVTTDGNTGDIREKSSGTPSYEDDDISEYDMGIEIPD